MHENEANRRNGGGRTAKSRAASLAGAHLARICGSRAVRRIYEGMEEHRSDRPFYTGVLDELEICLETSCAPDTEIPSEGKAVVVANHPFGAIEGLILLEFFKGARPDVKILANSFLGSLEELRRDMILVDPFSSRHAKRANVEPLRKAVRFVQDGGLLAVFPAGEVAHLSIPKGIAEPSWHPAAAWIARRAEAPVLPVFFEGKNSMLFQLAGLVHPLLRTGLLARELFNKRGRTVEMHVGSLIPPRVMKRFAGAEEATEYIQSRTHLLGGRSAPRPRATIPEEKSPAADEIVEPVSPDLLEAETRALGEEGTLATHRDLSVQIAPADRIPHLLNEIGRLRESTFRLVGEGTGKSIDLDRFDERYLHLYLWNRETREVLGAYRLGLVDELTRGEASSGLYLSTLFKLKPEFVERLRGGIEMGRSFVRPEHQRDPSSLFLLWKGIGRFVASNPRYRYLFGPVSISARYGPASHKLMVDYLRDNHRDPDWQGLARPRNPVRRVGWSSGLPRDAVSGLSSLDDLSAVICELEQEATGVPILIRQYLNLGGRVLSFNVDPDFSDAIDCLVLVDLTETRTSILRRYMGKEGTARFLAHHRDAVQAGSDLCAGRAGRAARVES